MISFQYNKRRIVFGVFFFVLFSVFGLWLIFEPEIFIRNFLMKKAHIQLLGILAFLYSIFMLYSFVILLFNRKVAFIISDNYLIDNSRYESIGKIHFSKIHEVKRNKKYSLKIVLKEPVFKLKRLNILQKILLMANNWSPNSSIIISSALMDCDVKVLETTIMSSIDKFRRQL